MLVVSAVRGAPMTLSQATWVEQTARESLTRAQVLGRELPDAELSSFLWIPVLCEGERIGVIEFGDHRGRWLTDSIARELSVLADEVGRLIARSGELEQRYAKAAIVEGELGSRSRECIEQRRLLSARASRDAIADCAVRIAGQAIDPSTYVLANLNAAREDIDAMQGVVDQFVAATEQLLRKFESHPGRGELQSLLNDEIQSLERALGAANESEFESCFAELEPLSREIEQGARNLRAIGEDLRELALGDSAPIHWVDVSQLIQQALAVIADREGEQLGVETRIAVLPPIHCQRLRLVSLLVSLLDHVIEKATPDSAIGIQAELRGSNAVIEISIEGSSLICGDGGIRAFGISPDEERIHRDIAEDHDALLESEVIDDIAVLRLSIPTDRE